MPSGPGGGPTARTLRRSDPRLPKRRVQRGLAFLLTITVIGTIGYVVIGLELVDAAYQTIITVSTVGYREVAPDEFDRAYQAWTVLVILSGVGTAFYTLGVLLESLVEGRLTDHLWRRRMERSIATMSDHVIVCGWGRVGQTISHDLVEAGKSVVVIDVDPERLEGLGLPFIEGDATDDAVLAAASIERASALVAALDSDAANLWVTLTGRSKRPDLFIVARARVESAEAKLAQAGANRVVNPQHIGGQRIAAMILQPSVADFLDVVMHDAALEFRLAEMPVAEGSSLAGLSLRDAHLRDRTGALVLAMRDATGGFRTNPPPDTPINPGEVLIAIGTPEQLAALRHELARHEPAR